jgi:hypothetical protein
MLGYFRPKVHWALDMAIHPILSTCMPHTVSCCRRACGSNGARTELPRCPPLCTAMAMLSSKLHALTWQITPPNCRYKLYTASHMHSLVPDNHTPSNHP